MIWLKYAHAVCAKTLDKNVWRIRKIYSTKSPSLLFTVVNPQMNQSHSLAHLIKLRSSHYLWSSFWIFVTKDVDKIIPSAVPPVNALLYGASNLCPSQSKIYVPKVKCETDMSHWGRSLESDLCVQKAGFCFDLCASVLALRNKPGCIQKRKLADVFNIFVTRDAFYRVSWMYSKAILNHMIKPNFANRICIS